MTPFARKLKKLRAVAGLSQGQLARAAGLSNSAVASWEQGRTEPRWESIIALQRALRIPFEDFIPDELAISESGVDEEVKPARKGK